MKLIPRRLLRAPITAVRAICQPWTTLGMRQRGRSIGPALARPAQASLRRALVALVVTFLPAALAAADAPTRYQLAAGAVTPAPAGRYQLTLTAPEEPAAPRFHLLVPTPDKLQAGTCEIADAIFAHGFEN